LTDRRRPLTGLPEPDAAGREVLRQGREGSPLTPGDYLAFLEALARPGPNELAGRPLLDGEPFTLARPGRSPSGFDDGS
jgi:hypothetical protein